MNERAAHPHCDELVLHAPGTCAYCNEYPERQAARVEQGINFTGESDPNKKPCPSTERRSIDVINRWPGNRPRPTQ